MQKTIINLILAGVSMGAAAGIFAQENPKGFGFSQKLGEADLYPAVRLEYRSDSNVFLDSENETDGSGFRVVPELLYVAGKGQISLKAQYKGDYHNSDVSAASYADHALSFQTEAEFSGRLRGGAELSFEFDHQDIGTRFTRGIADENTDAVEFNRTGLTVFGNYGANSARGNIELGLVVENVDFTNQSALTDGESNATVEPYGIFSMRVSPDIRATAELRFGATDYDNDLLDRTDTTFLLGINIAPARKLSGFVKVGSTLTSLDNRQTRDVTELTLLTALRRPIGSVMALRMSALLTLLILCSLTGDMIGPVEYSTAPVSQERPLIEIVQMAISRPTVSAMS